MTTSAKSIVPYSITAAIMIAKNIMAVIKNGKTKNINTNFFICYLVCEFTNIHNSFLIKKYCLNFLYIPR